MEFNGPLNGTLIVIKPSGCLCAKVEPGTKQPVILAVAANLIHAELGKVGMSTMLDNQRSAVSVNHL